MTTNRILASIIIVPIIISGIYGYYKNIEAMKGSTLLNALAFVDEHWQDGDVIFVTDDGPWVGLAPYTDKTIYRMKPCGVTLGQLSQQTRDAIGMIVTDLDDIPHKRAWIFAPTSPLHPQCYFDQIADLTSGIPEFIVDESEWLNSAVWLKQ